MGTWASGLWDNDSSVDAVGGLIRVAPSKDLFHLLTSWGLRLWFGQGAGVDRLFVIHRPVS